MSTTNFVEPPISVRKFTIPINNGRNVKNDPKGNKIGAAIGTDAEKAI